MVAARSHRCAWALLAVLIASVLLVQPSSAAVALPTGQVVDKIDFERHIMGLVGRTGCNAGACHGSFQGKGGFRLSLFGYEPDKDYLAITRDQLGRRVNVTAPDESLLLLKATGQMEHAGGVRFTKNSWQYEIFRQWIAEGAQWTPRSGLVQNVAITPPELAFKKAEESAQLKVLVRFADQSEHDLTAFSDFRTNDDAVAEVSNMGLVQSLRPGSTSLIVAYRGTVLPVRVLVPMALPTGFTYPRVPEVNYIDHEVFARLRQMNMVPSDLASDEEFLRRVTIDTLGCLPTPEEVRAFLNDSRPDKRARKIDELLAHPLHAALWATRFCDFTGNDTQALEQPVPLKAKRSQMWHDWFRKRLHENMPYDEMVRGILTATSRAGKSPQDWLSEVRKSDEAMQKGFDSDYAQRPTLDLFWRRQQQVTIEQWGERTAAAFFGIRLECAQCHKHPFDRWSQAEYRAFANIFGQLAFGASPETKKVIDAENAERRKKDGKNNNRLNLVKEVYLTPTPVKSLPHPDSGAKLAPRPLGGPALAVAKGQDLRAALFTWLRTPDNPYFARAFVNRVWGHYLGLGLVHPVDDFSLANPPSNEKLLDALAKDFVAHRFDIRHIERTILNSRAYQLSSKTNSTNKLDKNNYAHSYVRPLLAEAVVDVLNSALGVTEKWSPDIRPGSRAVEVGASQLPNAGATYAFRIFGRPVRSAPCDCERSSDPALPQKLYLMTDPALLAKFQDSNGRLQKLLKSKLSDEQILEELFLATLTRYPSAADRHNFAEHRRQAADRTQAFTDTLWALINTREFILNH